MAFARLARRTKGRELRAMQGHPSIDFRELARDVPELRAYLHIDSLRRASIDFQDPEASRRLSQAILKRDFGLIVDLPHDRLCPAVPGRLDYVQWLLALLEASPPSPKANLLLLDVGTGASAIYALLLARSSPKAHIFATDVDAFSLKIARRNIEQNALQDRITLIDTSLSVDILPHLDVEIDASMCNPPYYASRAEIEELASIKADLPTGICTGADSDMITTGGELGFVTRMIDESAARPNAIRWCTTQLGRLSSLEPLLKRLAHHHIDNYALCESTQSRTKRWLLAWSLQGDRLPDTIARSANLASKHLLPLPNTVGRVCRAGLKLPTVRDALLEHLLALSLQVESSDNAILVAASQPSWTRAARRAAERNEAQPSDVVIMRVLLELAQRGDDVVVSSTWQYGLDRQLFQSFCSHVWRQIDVS